MIVTATRIEEPLQQVPMSISAVTGAHIERRAIGNLTELSRWILPGWPCATFATHIREFFEFRNAVLRALGFQPWCQRRSIRFFYSDLTAGHVLVPARLIDGWSFEPDSNWAFNPLLSMATSTSWTPERPLCRKPFGGGSPTVTHCREKSYASLADVS